MASNIRPKDFENYLPEETDTVAQGLVKFVQFAILFWRWFRSEFKTDGTFGFNMKSELCATGCTESDVLDSDPDDRDTKEEERDKGNGPVIPGDPPPPSIINTECCKMLYDYGGARMASDFDEWGDFQGEDMDFFYFKQSSNRRGDTDLFCDENKNKLVAFKSRKGKIHFSSNEAWRDAVKTWTTFAPSHVFDNVGQSYTVPGISGGEARVIDNAYIEAGDWGTTEVVIYGTTDTIDWPTTPIRTKAKITGEFNINPGLSGKERKIPFLINTSGNWCVRLLVYSWPSENSTAGGWSGRSFGFHIDGAVNPRYYQAGQKSKLHWCHPNGKQYLTKVYGIRITNVNHLAHNMLSETMGGRNVAQIGEMDRAYVVYDERWQNENPCFVPWYGWSKESSEAKAYLWARDSSGMGAGTVYTHETVNVQKITYDSIDHLQGLGDD